MEKDRFILMKNDYLTKAELHRKAMFEFEFEHIQMAQKKLELAKCRAEAASSYLKLITYIFRK